MTVQPRAIACGVVLFAITAIATNADSAQRRDQLPRPSPSTVQPAPEPTATPGVVVRVWASGKPLANAQVRWKRIRDVELRGPVLTLVNGEFVPSGVTEGTYYFEVRYGGRTIGREVNIIAGRTTVDFDLSAASESAIEQIERRVADLEMVPIESASISWPTVVFSGLAAFVGSWLSKRVRRWMAGRPRPQHVSNVPNYAGSTTTTSSGSSAASGNRANDFGTELPRDHPVWQMLQRLKERIDTLEGVRTDVVEEVSEGRREHSDAPQMVSQWTVPDQRRPMSVRRAVASHALFAEIPDPQGRFSAESLTPERRSESLFEIQPFDERTAVVTICQQASGVQAAIQNHKSFLLPVCEYVDQLPQYSHTRIEVTEPGGAIRDDKGWLVNRKIHIRFS